MAERCTLHLVRDWGAAWADLVQPWLTTPRSLQRDYVLVPTRGQAQALKLRCVRDGVALLGVEFLTPGLARAKLTKLIGTTQSALGRELLLLNLRTLIAERLAPLTSEDAAWGLWKSLQSDPERALDDFDHLLQGGFTAQDFPLAPLRDIFGELTQCVADLGYQLSPVQNIAMGLQLPPADAPQLGGRLLIYGFTAEHWREFFALTALARRTSAVTVVLPEPELRGQRALDEHWITAWEAALGVEAMMTEPSRAVPTGAAVARLWREPAEGKLPAVRVQIGQTRRDEMALVADEVVRLLNDGARNIAVVFPQADAAQLRLVRLLTARGVPFNNLLEAVGPPEIDAALQAALLRFYSGGGRVEGLLALWPYLHALEYTTLDCGAARGVAERLFDELQTHTLPEWQPRLAAATKNATWREVARLVGLLLPVWPDELSVAEALARFEATGKNFRLALPETWQALRTYAARDRRVLPAKIVLATLEEFLVTEAPALAPLGRGLFAPVTLTTHRRAASLEWEHTIFAESNAGVWPVRTDSSCWLTDEHRLLLNEKSRFSIGVMTSEARAELERQSCTSVAANTTGTVIFSAALFDDEEPELQRAPNAWLERILLAQPAPTGGERNLDKEFTQRAVAVTDANGASADTRETEWRRTWAARRDPTLPFDDNFFCADPVATRPARLSAGLIERAVRDPAELWFGAVLELQQVDWSPLARARRKTLGQAAHRVLAEALQGELAVKPFRQMPSPAAARAQLAGALARLRGTGAPDRYGESFHAELGEICRVLLEKIFTLPPSAFVATEVRLPPGTTLPLVESTDAIEVVGRIDLVLSDRPAWAGATVDIVDFKTGADAKISVATMARGASLQLGVYLAAARTLGVVDGTVWMVKPSEDEPSSVTLAQLPEALVTLQQLAAHLATGRYGALTPDRSEYARGTEWPLACTPVAQAVLRAKFARTFARAADAEEACDDDA